MDDTHRPRRGSFSLRQFFFTYSLRSLLLLMILSALVFAYLVPHFQRDRAIAALQKRGFKVELVPNDSILPHWLADRLGSAGGLEVKSISGWNRVRWERQQFNTTALNRLDLWVAVLL